MTLNGFTIGAGAMRIDQGARLAFTTDGKLVNLLPSATDLVTGAIDLAFPDVTKDSAYLYQGFTDIHTAAEYAASFISMVPQFWSNSITLGAVPNADVNFIEVQVKASRIVAPATMYGRAVPKCVPEGEWFDMGGGSAPLELVVGMGRYFGVVIEGGYVKVKFVQTVQAAPRRGWRPGNATNTSDGKSGWSYGSQKGTPIYNLAVFPRSIVMISRTHYRGGSQALSTNTSAANFNSTWRLYFNIAFGRVS